MLSFHSLLLFLCATGFATAHLNTHYVHDSRVAIPSGFTKLGPAPAAKVLSLRMNLVQNNIAGLEAKLEDISTPNTPNFRHWLTQAEVRVFTQPLLE